MRSQTSKAFRKLFAQLPRNVQRQAYKAYKQFKNDPDHPGLAFKPISKRDPSVYSARVGLHWRVIGFKEGDTVNWTWIGSHAEYDQIIKQ